MPHNPNDPNELITAEQLDAITALNKAQSWLVVVANPNPADPRHPHTAMFYNDCIAIAGLIDEASMHLDQLRAISAELLDDDFYDDLNDDFNDPPP